MHIFSIIISNQDKIKTKILQINNIKAFIGMKLNTKSQRSTTHWTGTLLYKMIVFTV